MEKRKFFTFKNLVYLFSTVFYVVIGIFAFVICGNDFSDKDAVLALLIILSSVPHLLIYAADRRKLSYLVIGFVGLAFGIVFLTTNDLFTTDQICMIWGCIDICRGLTEIINVAPKVKQNKGEIIEICISTGDIIIGVLLCIHMLGGIKLHIIYMGIAFIIYAVKNISDLLLDKVKNEKDLDCH